MRAGIGERMAQHGIVPALTEHLKRAYPDVSASLWQRRAKTEYKRIVAALDEPLGDGVYARQQRMVRAVAALLLAFHEGAPQDVDLDEGAFSKMVDVALATPVVHMAFSGFDPFSDEGTRAVEAQLAAGREAEGPDCWAGTLRVAGDQVAERASEFVICMERCGLLQMCVREKRLYLLKHLCRIEAVQAAAWGGILSFGACIADGGRCCELLCACR